MSEREKLAVEKFNELYKDGKIPEKDVYKRQSIDEQLKTEVQSSLQPALGRIALKGIAYDQLPLYTKEIANELNTELTADWNELRGIYIVSVAFASITVDGESAEKISRMQEARAFSDPSLLGARLGTACLLYTSICFAVISNATFAKNKFVPIPAVAQTPVFFITASISITENSLGVFP